MFDVCARTAAPQQIVKRAALPYHKFPHDFVGLEQDGLRNCEAERLRDALIDVQLEPGRLLDREVSGSCSFKDLCDVARCLSIRYEVGAGAYGCTVGQQGSGLSPSGRKPHQGNTTSGCQSGNFRSVLLQMNVREGDEGMHLRFRENGESGFEIPGDSRAGLSACLNTPTRDRRGTSSDRRARRLGARSAAVSE